MNGTERNLHVFQRRKAGVQIIRLRGEVDYASVLNVFGMVMKVASERYREVVVDLTEVSLIDSEGVKPLLKARCKLSETGGKLLVVCPEPSLPLRVFQIAGLTSIFDLAQNIDGALEALQKRSA